MIPTTTIVAVKAGSSSSMHRPIQTAVQNANDSNIGMRARITSIVIKNIAQSCLNDMFHVLSYLIIPCEATIF